LATLALRLPPAHRGLVAGVAAVAVTVAVLAPALTERAHYDRHGAALIRQQQRVEAAEGHDLDGLVALAQSRGDGRVYAGLRSNWGAEYKIGAVPVYAWLADRRADAIGFTFRTIASHSNDTEAYFDEANPAHYEMFNVRYVLLPDGRKPSVPARLLASGGVHRLWEVQTTGYLQVVDRAASVKADRTDLAQATRDFMQSDLASRGIYPGVAFAGAAAAPPTFTGDAPPSGPAGSVVKQAATLENGVFEGTVAANRPAVVLLKASYDPRWAATVDGRPAKTMMMAPSLVGVEVPAGRHEVRFHYEPVGTYPLLLAAGALTLLGLALYPRRRSLVRARSR